MNKIDDFRLQLGKHELVPIIIGGMGVDISSDKLALQAARLGGIGHISDAMIPTVTDRHYKTTYVKDKFEKYKLNKFNSDKSIVQFDLAKVAEATKLYVEKTINRKKGSGLVFINCMEKLLMNNPLETLRTRLASAMEAGIDGITLSAGLHLSSLRLIQDHPRFKDVFLGIIVSSVRALKIFLSKAAKTNRLPDYIVVEGPLAGGHLGFGFDWKKYQLKTIVKEVVAFLKKVDLNIPIIPAGGVFSGTDGVEYLKMGTHGVQVATRFTITEECGLPSKVKQKYFESEEEDVIVSNLSPTGYPMRVLKNSPALTSGIRPNCEMYGFLLNRNGHCAYIDAYNRALEQSADKKRFQVHEKSCLCTHMRDYKCWTCGHYVYRLKETSNLMANGLYQLPTAEHVFLDYQYSVDHQIKRPVSTETQEQELAMKS